MFDGTDFAYWLMQVEGYLYQHKIVKSLKGSRLERVSEDDQTILRVVHLTKFFMRPHRCAYALPMQPCGPVP